jgi:hypothetical protein
MIAQNDGIQNDFMDFGAIKIFQKVRQLVSFCHLGLAQSVIPDYLNLSSRTRSGIQSALRAIAKGSAAKWIPGLRPG